MARPSPGERLVDDPTTPVDLDVFGLQEESIGPPISGSIPSESPIDSGRSNEDSPSVPARLKPYKPLSESKKKQIAKRAAKIDRSKPSTAAFGVSFGAVLTFALIGWRIYRILNGIQRAAARADAFQSAPADIDAFDAGTTAAETDRMIGTMISQPTTAEARDWLDPAKHPNRSISEMPAEAARDMVAGFYERAPRRSTSSNRPRSAKR